MTSRERVFKTLNHEEIDRFPRTLWALPGVGLFKADQLADFYKRFETDIMNPKINYGKSRYAQGTPGRKGNYVDEFGCFWTAAEEGIVGEVKKPVLADWDDYNDYRFPTELIDELDLTGLDEQCKASDKFVLANTYIRPFERMQFMRGTENLFIDLASGEPMLEKLAGKLHDMSMRELDLLTDRAVDAVSFMDDWGTQISLLISPKTWEQFFKPMYKEYSDLAHSKGKKIFFHSDGNIEAIYPHLVEIGIDAINSQLFCMNIEGLVEKYGDKVTFWGEIDRQFILPFGTTEEVKKAVRRVACAVIKKNGKRTGAFAQCEWNAFDPYENILTVFEEWDKQ